MLIMDVVQSPRALHGQVPRALIVVQRTNSGKIASPSQKKFFMLNSIEMATASSPGQAERPISVRCLRTAEERKLIVIVQTSSIKWKGGAIRVLNTDACFRRDKRCRHYRTTY